MHDLPADLGLKILLGGCEHVYSDVELKHKLEKSARERRPLRVKLGMDPTAPDIHFGHSVVLGKLRQFQDLGHKAILIIGDFTARIGDPTGRSETRKMLSENEIRANAQTYIAQAGRILDTTPDKFEVRWNGEWLDKMSFADVLKLAGRMTIGQLLKRDDFRKRFESETPIGLHEFLYPLVQGWDSVSIQADVELGGTDQMYNNLVGRDLQVSVGQEPQVVMLMPLLRGLDGERKMSKSYGNHIALTDSALDMFGKTLSISDALLPEWFALLTSLLKDEAASAIAEHPMEAKKRLACLAGERYHGRETMAAARSQWEEAFGARAIETVDVAIPSSEIVDGKIPAWKLCWLAHDREISKSEARRMVEGGAFEFDGEKTLDPNFACALREDSVFRAGRHRKGERVKQPLVARAILHP
jgi:tyrosyl-tRNA synthetase